MAEYPGMWDENPKPEPDTEDEERAEQDRFVAGRADIWRSARAMLFNAGELSPQPEQVVDLARFLAGDAS
ncbi:hypothetical protein ACWD3J_15530 [Streptomyces sp. NPDC002755]